MLVSVTATAQFTVYEPVIVPERSTGSSYGYNNPYSGYGNPYSDYGNPYNNSYRPAPKPKAKTYTLTGYYRNNTGWYQTQIRVSVKGEEIKLVGVKYGNNWTGCNSNVSEVGGFDTKEVQDHFNYKGYFYLLGMVYF